MKYGCCYTLQHCSKKNEIFTKIIKHLFIAITKLKADAKFAYLQLNTLKFDVSPAEISNRNSFFTK